MIKMTFFRRKYGNYYSFYGKVRAALAMLSVIPLLVVIYLFLNYTEKSNQIVLLMSALVLLSIFSGFWLLRASADQLGELANQLIKLEPGLKDQSVKVKADSEVNDIVTSINSLFSSIADTTKANKEQTVQLMIYARDLAESFEKIKAQEELRNKLSRYVGENLVEKLQNDLVFENEKTKLTILFLDIRSFTAISEQITAEEIVTMLNEYFDTVVDVILDNNGHLDKFIGDEIMAVFGVLPSQNHAAKDAVSAALEMQKKTREFIKIRSDLGKQVFQVGIGINTGEVIVGNVGSKNRIDYTVIGDVVNTASRIQNLARGGEIVIGEETYRHIKKDFEFEKRGPFTLKNKSDPINVYQVIRSTRSGDTDDLIAV